MIIQRNSTSFSTQIKKSTTTFLVGENATVDKGNIHFYSCDKVRLETENDAFILVKDDIRSLYDKGTKYLLNQSCSFIDTDYSIFKKAFDDFKEQLKSYEELIGEHKADASMYFSSCVDSISMLKPTNILFAFTGNESFSFRVFKGSFEVYLNIFFVKQEDDENVEVVTNIYKNNQVISKLFGPISEVFKQIKAIIEGDSFNCTTLGSYVILSN